MLAHPWRLRCPDCHAPLELAAMDHNLLACASDHAFGCDENGVLVLLSADFGPRLTAFTAAFSAIRQAEHRRLLDPTLYPQLPFAPDLRRDHEWRLRGHDWRTVSRLLAGRSGLRILDIGAWNGWLCHRLAGMGHEVVGIDYFSDPHDGLGARRWYDSRWTAIQMNLTDLAILPTGFDVVILNRCLQFQPDPIACLTSAARLLASGGFLLALGLQIFADPGPKARQITDRLAHFRQANGFDLFLWPANGYLDRHDLARLTSLGLAVRPYRALIGANLKAAILPSRPWHGFGVLQAGG